MSQLTSSTASRDALSPLTGSPRRSPTAALRARTSISTQASELDLLPLPKLEDARVLASRGIGSPGMSVLALPARPRRAVLHLRAAPAFLVDAAAFVRRSPGTLPAEGEPAASPSLGARSHIPHPLLLRLLLHARSPPWIPSRARGINSSKTRSPLLPPRAPSLCRS